GAGGAADVRADLADLLGDVEAHLVRVVEVRLDLDLRADVLSRHAERAEPADAAEPAERRGSGRARRAAGAGEARERAEALVGLERDVVADVDLGVLVVEREDVRRREEIGVAGLRDRLDEGAERGDRDAGAEEVLRARDAG